ncbi:uncharacterized protein ACA1_103210 [Acanthamoeba castellanii str. Neff]|uniref:Uncharacterized protein n=1 Tax=Acanthamoeba castellanii (strain ATCC 30010 / Neff) TaxID=1257118 RepID=L8GDM6_ACACF|nr:uncharacterized protein ACA1_103210 [Acanthamoeba castellanii str. Neff]ELR10964.1 hypothetical protein ACA1_103210 [Acanthamoeba castellanii str. Neff]
MKLLSSFIIPEAVVRNPHASLFVLFISAFTLFALTGEDNDLIRPRRKKSLFKRIFHVFGEDESPTLDVQGVVEGTALAAMAEEQDPAAIQEALEKLVKQLEQELCNERQDKERMHESMKKEEMLRQEAEEDLELVKQELNRQVQLYRVHMREEREKVIALEKELQGQSIHTQQLEAMLQLRDGQIEELEESLRQAADQEKGRSATQLNGEGSGSPSPNSSRSADKKRVFTIM